MGNAGVGNSAFCNSVSLEDVVESRVGCGGRLVGAYVDVLPSFGIGVPNSPRSG